MEHQFQLSHQIEEELGKGLVLKHEVGTANPNEVVLTVKYDAVRKIAEFLKHKKKLAND